MRIQKQICSIIFLSCLLPFILLVFIAFNVIKDDLHEMETTKLDLAYISGGDYLNNLIKNTTFNIDLVEELYFERDRDSLLHYLNNVTKHIEGVEDIAITGKDKLFITTSRKKEYYHNLDSFLSKNGFSIASTDKTFDHSSPLLVTVSRNINDDSKIGTIYFTINLDKLIKILNNFAKIDSGHLYFINNNYNTILEPREQKMMISKEEIAEAIKKGDSITTFNIQGTDYYYFIYQLGNLDFYLIKEINSELISLPFIKTSTKLSAYVAIAITFIILTLVISLFLFTKRLRATLKELTDIISKIARGDYEALSDYDSDCIDKYSELYFVQEEIKNLRDQISKRELELRRTSDYDFLTGIYSRGALYRLAPLHIQKSANSGSPLCMIVYDIDYLKTINDNYGHDKGDFIITEVIKTVNNCIRKSDIHSRYGGDEFIILFPCSTLEETVETAKRIKNKVNTLQFEFKVSISLGVSFWEGETLDEFIKKTDKKLYASKKNGRNTITY